jgi:hypothetical protein
MHITIICVPYQIDVARWGCALGPQAFLDHGLLELLQAKGHTVSNPIWIELPKQEKISHNKLPELPVISEM